MGFSPWLIQEVLFVLQHLLRYKDHSVYETDP
jgi:hypothetical protein